MLGRLGFGDGLWWVWPWVCGLWPWVMGGLGLQWVSGLMLGLDLGFAGGGGFGFAVGFGLNGGGFGSAMGLGLRRVCGGRREVW